MKILLDSLMVLANEGNIIFGILLALLLAGGVIFFLLKACLAKYLSSLEYFSLSIAGVLFPLFLGVSPFFLMSFLFKFETEFLFFPLLVFVCGFIFFVTRTKGRLKT